MRTAAIVLLTVALFVGGCASKPPPPLPWQALKEASSHRFEDLTQEQFFAAAEQVLMLADGDDFEIRYLSENELYATREYFIFALIAAVNGTHWWKIGATPRDGGIDATILIKGKGQIHSGSTPQDAGNPYVHSVANYTAFWERMDFILGRSSYWPTCDDIAAKWEAEENRYISSSSALCHGTMKDTDPRTGEATIEEQAEE